MSRVDRLRSGDRASTFKVAALGALGFVALLWVLEIIDALADNRLDQYGVRPRTDEGLVGIALAPLLHGGWVHLQSNSFPALVLLFLVLVSGVVRGLEVTGIVWLVGGVGVWLLGPSGTNHIGASVLVFGWLVYVIVRGLWTRHLGEIALGVVVFLVWGSLLLGVLPGQPGVSWQGHLFGALGGALAAWLVSLDDA